MTRKDNDLIVNKKAYHLYEILEDFEAGIRLVGTEIKSLRDQGGSLQEGYVKVSGGEVWLVGASIPPYRFGNIHNHEDKRPRKLLLHKREISRLKQAVQEKGLTIVPLSMYLKKGMAKIKIATARGKKAHDKRASLKEKDEKRRMDRAMKQQGHD